MVVFNNTVGIIDTKTNNFGDISGPRLFEFITNKKPKIVSVKKHIKNTHYLIVGSILRRAKSNSVVWGVGFNNINARLENIPKKICAVRGPLTRKSILEKGIKCPKIYGDPALLFPKFYNPNIKKIYKLGVIPHYVDKNNEWIKSINDNDSIKIIDIEAGIFNVITNVLSCEKILSSSLHGLIVADAYGIPSKWIELSNKIFGDGFKFRDYMLSVNRIDMLPFKVLKDTTIDEILHLFSEYKIDINLNILYNSCPFKK